MTLCGVVSLAFTRSSAIWKVKVFWTSPMIRMFLPPLLIPFTYQQNVGRISLRLESPFCKS